jgi:hypothetical protein
MIIPAVEAALKMRPASTDMEKSGSDFVRDAHEVVSITHRQVSTETLSKALTPQQRDYCGANGHS